MGLKIKNSFMRDEARTWGDEHHCIDHGHHHYVIYGQKY